MIGVTGATGEIGGRVARILAERDTPTRLIVRDPTRAPALENAEVVQFGGYNDRDGMRHAFEGISTLFLVSATEASDRADQHRAAVDAAVTSGVIRIVYLSIISAASDATFTFARDHFHTEKHIRKSGVAFTFSRQSLYTDILPLLGGPNGVIRGPAGDGKLAPVARDDVAEALVTMLTEPGHEGATYQLTGPESIDLNQAADLISRHTGQSVVYENETLEEAYASRAHYGAPQWEVDGWVSTYTAIAAGEMDVVTDHVEVLTGHPAVSVEEFLKRMAKA